MICCGNKKAEGMIGGLLLTACGGNQSGDPFGKYEPWWCNLHTRKRDKSEKVTKT